MIIGRWLTVPHYPAWAKINLGLIVGAKRPDGYHDISSVMQTISLADKVEARIKPCNINLTVKGADLPVDGRNLAFKAAKLMKNKGEVKKGIDITLTKRIPLASGLAGGSADAGAVLYLLNELWHLGFHQAELMRLGATLGSDVPFSLYGGTALATGRGEVLLPLSPLPSCYVLLACPNIEVSTAWAYSELDHAQEAPRFEKLENLMAALREGSLTKVAKSLTNSFESVVAAHYPVIFQLKHALLNNGAIGTLMSGSGPTVFGIFDSREQALGAANYLQSSHVVTHLARPVAAGAGRFFAGVGERKE